MKRQRGPMALLICLAAALPGISHATGIILQENGRADADGKMVWYDAKLLGVEGKGWTDTESYYDRLPLKAKGSVREPVWELSRCSTGLQIRFGTTAKELQVHWTVTKSDLAMPHMPATGVSGVDLYYKERNGGFKFCGNGRPEQVANTASFRLPPGEEYLLYLPLYNGVDLVELGIPEGETLSRVPPPALSRSIVFYGTSITQGGCASRPGMATTSIVSRELDVPVINLGFSGNGRMEPELADLLCELNPAVYVLDTLWNMQPDMVSERVEPFIEKLRKVRPDTPILLVEDSSIKDRPTPKGDILRRIHEKLCAAGDANLYFLSNAGMLGEDGEATVDGVHFTDLGMARQAAAFTKCLQPILEEQQLNRPDTGEATRVSEIILEVSCGQCQFGMEGPGCDLAVNMNGKIYWVVGTGIDDHGDAHAGDGFCNAVRKAKVSGTIKGDKLIVDSLVLLDPGSD